MSVQFGGEKPLDAAFVDDVLEAYDSGGLTLEVLSNIFSGYMSRVHSEHDIEGLSHAYIRLYDELISQHKIICQNCGFGNCRCSEPSNLGSGGEDN